MWSTLELVSRSGMAGVSLPILKGDCSDFGFDDVECANDCGLKNEMHMKNYQLLLSCKISNRDAKQIFFYDS